ncbi:MAG: GNAT family N-acetyltransferase [Ktedonobacterales bacterium]
MPLEDGYRIEPRSGLSGEEAIQVAALKVLCDVTDRLDLKVQPEMQRAGDLAGVPDTIIARRDGVIAGCCTLDGGSELEICGMVHPAHRRRGVGRALLDAARDLAVRRNAARALLICEDASTGGRALLASVLGDVRADFKELRMELDASPAAARGTTSQGVEVRVAGAAELDTLAATQAAVFDDSPQSVRWNISHDMADPRYRYYLATRNGQPVSSLKVIFVEPRAYIYAFGVVPGERRQGVGRAVLAEVIARLRTEGWRRTALEVETDNSAAMALYRSLGFHDVTTYGYYPLPL